MYFEISNDIKEKALEIFFFQLKILMDRNWYFCFETSIFQMAKNNLVGSVEMLTSNLDLFTSI